MSETGFAIYWLIQEPKPLMVGEPAPPPYGTIDEPKRELAALLEEQLDPQTAIVDWAHKDDVQREMRRLIKRQLRVAGYAPEVSEALAERVLDLLKGRGKR